MPAHRGPFLGEAEDVPSASEDDLSAEQIHDLLKEAENRMRAKNTSAQKSRDSSESHFTLPKLNTGVIAKPYIRREGDVARVDSSRLLDQQDRGLSNDIRKVEDPLQVKKRLAEVGLLIVIPIFAYEEKFPNHFLDADHGPVLDANLQH